MRIILYISLFVLLFVYSWAQIYDGDIGHHIKAGEWMLAHEKILDRDIFSYTAYGNSWLNHSWLAEIILYYIYSSGGIDGLIYFKIIVLLLSYALLIKACRYLVPPSPINDTIIAILFIMSVASASARFMVRPLLFTFLGVSLSIYLFVKARKNINLLFFMPVVFILWVNLHAEFMLGFIMIAIFWLFITGSFFTEKIFKRSGNYNSKYYFKASLILFLSLAAMLINPYGLRLLIHPVTLTTSDLFMTRISEWLPPMDSIFRGQTSINFFYWFLGIGLLSFLANFKKKNFLFFLFFITFGLMSLSAIRFMPYLTMIGMPIVAENLVRSITLLLRFVRSGRSTKITLGRLGIISVIIWSIFLIKGRTQYAEFGLGLAEKVCYPVTAGKFLNQSGIKGNIFNMVDFGGYLILYHPDRSVFADGRLDVYGEKIYEDFLSPDEETFQKYNIDYLFLSFRHPATRGILYRNDNWPLIYWDDTALIYVKNSRENKDLIDRYGYKYIHPLTGSYNFFKKADSELKARVLKEIHQAIRTSPNSIRAHVVLGDINVELKDYKKAIQAYEEAVKLGKRYNTAYMVKIYHNLAKLYHNLNEYSKAEWNYRRVLNLARPGETIYDQALEDWAHLVYAQGNKKKALRLAKEAVKYKARSKGSILSSYPTSLATLALLYEDLGKKNKAVIVWQEVYETGWGDCRGQAIEHLQQLEIKK